MERRQTSGSPVGELTETDPSTDGIASCEDIDRAIYLDLEWSCGEGAIPAGRYPELIEIGAVEVELRNLTTVKEAAYLIRPRFIDVSVFCTQITGL